MATATTNLNYAAIAYIDEEYPSKHYSLSSSSSYKIRDYYPYKSSMLFRLASISSSLKHKKLLGIQFLWYVETLDYYHRPSLYVYANKADFNASTVTWYKRPEVEDDYINGEVGYRHIEYDTATNYWVPAELNGTNEEMLAAAKALHAPSLVLKAGYNSYFNVKSVLNNGNTPYARVTYDSAVTVASKIVYKSGPKSGYKDPRNDITFSWTYEKANSSLYCAVESWTQSSAIFYWKKSTDANYTSISISGNTTFKTIAANTFPTASTIQWYVKGTDEDGTVTQTPVYSFSTAAGTASATPVSPINSVEDGSAPITFSWKFSSTDGQTPIRALGQWRLASESSWTLLFNVSNTTSTSVAAGTFPAGEIQWRVRAYNVDDTAGSFSSVMSFISVAAPDPVEGLSATERPFTTISWQSDEQEAYEISIDGKVVQKAFGTDYSWKSTTPLEDGDHLISVRVQGVYGLWSQPSEITITVSNSPTRTLTLAGRFGIDAELVATLSGTASSSFSIFHWYRDGEYIGVTNSLSFTDRTSIGRHEYYCEFWYLNGNYIRSNTVTGTTSTEFAMISLLSGSAWLSLAKSDSSNGGQSFDRAKTASFLRVTGSQYPVLELSEFETLTGSYRCAFRYAREVEQFESFFGRPVIVKSKDNVIVGALTQIKKTVNTFYTVFSFSVQQIHWEGFVDDQRG